MPRSFHLQRRRFLQYAAASTASMALPGFLPAAATAATNQIRYQASANFHADVEIEFSARPAYLPILNHGANTHVFKYYAKLLKGPKHTLQHLPENYLGPILHFHNGQKIRIFFNNGLPEPSIIHWHGLHVPQKSDGHPMYAIAPGQRFVYEFEVVNRAGTYFHHSLQTYILLFYMYFYLLFLIDAPKYAPINTRW